MDKKEESKQKAVSVLFARKDSIYKTFDECDVWDVDRDASQFSGNLPVICHPPCRAWGRLSHFANPEPGEKEYALRCVDIVRRNGGILEHPYGSKLWPLLVQNDIEPDAHGGYTTTIDQWHWGHVARKKTKLYIVGPDYFSLPLRPHREGETPKRSICGGRGKTRCTGYQREYTPEMLCRWLIKVATQRNG